MAGIDVTPSLRKSAIVRLRGASDLIYPNPGLSSENTEILEDLNITRTGTGRKRFGYDEFNAAQITESSAAKDITGLAQIPFKAGTKQVEFAGTKFYEDDGTTRTDRVGTLSLTDNADLRWRTVFIQDSMVATNGTDETVRWTGSGAATNLTAGANIPFTLCRDLVIHNRNLLILRPTVSGTDHTTRVMWADLNLRQYTIDITNVPTDSFAEVYDQGPPIIGGVDFNEFCYIFKEDDFYLTKLDYDRGFIELDIIKAVRGFEPIATNSILSRVGNPSFAFVVARDGAYRINPDNTFHRVTRSKDETWQDLNQSRLQHAVSFVREKDHQIRTLLSSSNNTSGHDRVMVYNWETGDVWFDILPESIGFADSWIISNVEYDIFGSADGYVHQANNKYKTDDNGNDISWRMKFAPNDLSDSNGQSQRPEEKNIINLVTLYRSKVGLQTIALSVFLDEGGGEAKTQTTNLKIGTSLTYDSGNKYDNGLVYRGGVNERFSFFINRQASRVQPQYTGTDDFEFQGYFIEYEEIE